MLTTTQKAFSFLLLILSFSNFAQNINISGHVTDADSGEDLMGVNIYLKTDQQKGTVTNYYGYYSLSLPKGSYTLVFDYMGYESEEISIEGDKDVVKNIKLHSKQETLEKVVITGKTRKRNIKTTAVGVHRLTIKEINNIPVLLGEKDIIKTIQLLPGVKPAGEGMSGFYVRGGNIDENLILLDQAPVYNASHVLGFFSVFNSDALRDAKIYKGHIPARYGGRLSSVLEIRMKEGNNQDFHAQGGIGLISSRLTLEGPIVKDKSSFVISGRRTYVDMVAKAITSDEDLDNTTLYFYDLNLKANYKFNDKNRLFISGYFGRDKFGFKEEDSKFGFSWGNATTTLRFNHLFNKKLFSNTSLIFSDYNYLIKLEEQNNNNSRDQFFFNLGARIQDITLKNSFNYYVNEKNKVNFGFETTHHTLKPSTFDSSEDIEEFNLEDVVRYAFENALYISNEQKINDKLKIYYALRYTNFLHMGGGNFSKYDKNGNVIFTKKYDRNQVVKAFHGLAPRLSLSYAPDNEQSIKMAFDKTYQFLHLMSSSTSSNPTDVWMPSGLNIPQQYSYQGSLGYFRNLKKGLYEFSTEVYYRTMRNVVDYRVGANISLNPEVEKDLVYGQGKAYGIEFLLRKKQGKFTGWLSYTLSRSLKQFDAVNNGNWFSATQDRIHDVSVVANYKISERAEIGGVFVYYTGNATTFPAGYYQINGQEYPYFTERNGGRMPSYNRMDISFTLHNKPEKKFRSSWNFSIYNVYGRLNPYLIFFDREWNEDHSYQLKTTQITLFRWVPSVTYNFKF